MKLRDLIAQLQAIEAEHGPEVHMTCWDENGYETPLSTVDLGWGKPTRCGSFYACCSSNTSGAVRVATLA